MTDKSATEVASMSFSVHQRTDNLMKFKTTIDSQTPDELELKTLFGEFHLLFSGLPTNIKVHILHLSHNPIITGSIAEHIHLDITETLSTIEKSTIMQMKPNLSYILLRLPEDQQLQHGIETFFSRQEANSMKRNYISYALEHDLSRSVWFEESTMVFSYIYQGMGHFTVKASLLDQNVPRFFEYTEGGANGYDQYEKFKQIAKMKKEELVFYYH